MWPRLHCFIYPLDSASGLCRVRVIKGWWMGPGHGGRQATIADVEVTIRSTDDRERMRLALRAAADAL